MAGYAAGLTSGSPGTIGPTSGQALMGNYASLLQPSGAAAPSPGGDPYQLALTGDQLTPGQASIVESILTIFNSAGTDLSPLARK